MSDYEIDKVDLELRLIDLFNEYEGVYDAPKLKRELDKHKYYASIKRISRYMKRLGLRSIIIKKYKPRSNSKAPDDKPNHMNQDFKTTAPNQKWVMDITYVWTVHDGWTYLASVMNLHSRMIIGYSYEKHMRKEMVVESIKQAINKAGFSKD